MDNDDFNKLQATLHFSSKEFCGQGSYDIGFEMPNVILQSRDNCHFTVDVEVVKVSGVLRTMLDVFGEGLEEGREPVIPLPNVPGDILKLVIQWANHHRDDLPVLWKDGAVCNGWKNYIPEWDCKFLQVGSTKTLFALIQAADYLDIQGLLDVACMMVGNKIARKSASEVRRILDIHTDFAPTGGKE